MRHPSIAVAGFLLLLFAVISAAVGMRGLALQEQELRRGVLEMNAYAASGHAAAVLYQLREKADELRQRAENPEVIELALTTSPLGPPRVLPAVPRGDDFNPCAEQLELADPSPLLAVKGDFDMLNVLDARGCARARMLPPNAGYETNYFGWRDYYTGPRALGLAGRRSVHVGRVFRSFVRTEIRYSLSTPLFADGEWVGVLSAGITVDATSTLPAIRRVQTPDRMTVLLGRFEGNLTQTRASSAPDYIVLAHPLLARGAEQLIPSGHSDALRTQFGDNDTRDERFALGKFALDQFALSQREPLQLPDYVDPLTEGHWLAAFAPVGNTGYVILVQTREQSAVSPSSVLLRQFATWFVALGSAGLLTFVAFAVWVVRRGREHALSSE